MRTSTQLAHVAGSVKRPVVSLLVVAVALAMAASAEAKFSAARVCGVEECSKVTLLDNERLIAMEEIVWKAEVRLGAKPPVAAPWYRVTMCPGNCDSRSALTLRVLPSAGYAFLPSKVWHRVTGATYPPQKAWARLDDGMVAPYRRATNGLEPYPAKGLVAFGASAPSRAPTSGGAVSDGGPPTWVWAAIAALAAAMLATAATRRPWRSLRSRSVR